MIKWIKIDPGEEYTILLSKFSSDCSQSAIQAAKLRDLRFWRKSQINIFKPKLLNFVLTTNQKGKKKLCPLNLKTEIKDGEAEEGQEICRL